MNKYEAMMKWIPCEIKLQEKFEKRDQRYTCYPHGSIYTCFFGINIGHEKSRLLARPCIIVSTDKINTKSTNVIVVPLSKDIKYKKNKRTLVYPWHYVLRQKNYPELEYDSAVQCEDIRCVSKARLSEFISTVNEYDMEEIEKRLRRTLEL